MPKKKKAKKVVKKTTKKTTIKKDARRIKWAVEVWVGKKVYSVKLVLSGPKKSDKFDDETIEEIRQAFHQQYGYKATHLDQFKLFEITKA